jgi:hypothetical protein
MAKDICILCGNETSYEFETHVDMRVGYIDGAGQLCSNCYEKGDQSSRELMTIPMSMILQYPNDMELGGKIREMYWDIQNNK